MKILVTGGTGFVGSHLVDRLVSTGHEVYSTKPHMGHKEQDVRCPVIDDYRDLGKVDVVFHLAANNDTLETDDCIMYKENVSYSLELFQWACETGCRKIVYASSTAVYGNGATPYQESQKLSPLNAYARSKVAVEIIAQSMNKKHQDVIFVGLRYCNIYGPGESHKGHRMSMVSQLINRVKADKRVQLFANGEQRRDWIYVKDVVAGNIAAMQNCVKSCIVNCGYGKAYTFNYLVSAIYKTLGQSALAPVYIMNPYKSSYQSHTECDMREARMHLEFTPKYNLKNGLLDYFKTERII